MLKQKKAKKVKEDVSNWRHDLREIIVTADKDAEEPEIKEKKIKNKITINPQFKEAVEEIGGELLEVDEMDPKKYDYDYEISILYYELCGLYGTPMNFPEQQ